MTEPLNNKQIWKDCLESIKVSVSPPIFSTWFSQTHLVNLKEKDGKYAAEVGCASPFAKLTIENRYYGLIQDSLNKSLNKPCELTFTVKGLPAEIGSGDKTPTPLFEEKKSPENEIILQITDSRLRPNFTFKNFAVSSSNQMAWAAAEAVTKTPGTAYNPLFIWGGVGVGKTHITNAVGYEMLKRNIDSKILFCTGEQFTNDIVEGIRNKTTQVFRNKYRKLDALMIDDIQFIAGKDAVQEEFFHTFNALASAGGQIILTSDQPPSEIPKLEERLRSRFEAGLIIDIGPPDFELRCAIIQIKSAEKGLDVPTDIVQLIAGNIVSARNIEGFLLKLSSSIRLNKTTNIDEELIASMLKKGTETSSTSKRVSPDEIFSAVSKHFSISKKALLGRVRVQTIVVPRQILMYLLKTYAGLPYKEVGRIVGGRDHTTVMHGVEKITNLASENEKIRGDIQGIKNSL